MSTKNQKPRNQRWAILKTIAWGWCGALIFLAVVAGLWSALNWDLSLLNEAPGTEPAPSPVNSAPVMEEIAPTIVVLPTPSPTPEPTLTPVPTEILDGGSEFDDADLDLFTQLIYAEAGAEWMPDIVQLLVGSVVLNRLADDTGAFPGETLYDIIYQPGQYGPAITGAIHNTPDERTRANAVWLLENGSIAPADVVYQAEFKQGEVYDTYYDDVLGTTIYFCFK